MTAALIAALAVCAVVAVRMWITARTDKNLPEYPPRHYLDLGLSFIAVASLVRAGEGWIDTVTHQPGLSDLGWRIPVAIAGGFLILYLEAQRTGRLISGQRILALTWPTMLVVCALFVLWLLIPIHPGSPADLLPAGYAAPWTERLYIVIFDAHLLSWTIPLSKRNWTLAKAAHHNWAAVTPRAKSTAIGQLGMSIAAATGSAAVAITIIRVLTFGILPLTTRAHLHTASTVLSYIAPVSAAIGIGFPAVANLIYTRQAAALLRQLDAVVRNPDPGAEPEQSRPPLGVRLQPFTFAVEYYRTQLADTLRSVTFTEAAALKIVTDRDPERTMGNALSDPCDWQVEPDQDALHRTAFKLLPIPNSSAEALQQLLQIARGYRASAASSRKAVT